ncbi:unnamed protein product, partial [Brassica oleracea var. botrytis]
NPNAVSLKGDFRRFSLIHRSLRRLSLRRLSLRLYHRRSLCRSSASFLSTVLPLPFSLPLSPPVISPPPIYNRVLKATISSPNFQTALHDDEYEELKESKLGVFIKFQELGFEWASRLVHYMLGFQLDIKKKYELWSLVGPQPVRFSLLEFENLTGLNCEYIEDLESPHCVVTKELTSFWEMLGIHLEAGPSTQEIIAAFGRCEGWSRDDRKRLAYLAIFTGYIEGRKYSTPTRFSLSRLVMELERFENHPWGRRLSSVRYLLRSLEPFTYARPTNIPPARAGDCGVYALKYIECHALGIEFSKKDFAKANGKSMRDKMAVDIFEEHPVVHEYENKDNFDNLDAYDG